MADNEVDTVLVVVSMAAGVFASSSPFFHEHDKVAPNVRNIRWGEAAATTVVVTMGAAVAASHRTLIPLLAAVLVSGVFVAGYEYMLNQQVMKHKHELNDDTGMNDAGYERYGHET